MSTTEEKRRSNRERMPNVAKMVDEFRAVFGDVKVIWAIDHETGVEVGNPRYADRFVEVTADYRPVEKSNERTGRSKAR